MTFYAGRLACSICACLLPCCGTKQLKKATRSCACVCSAYIRLHFAYIVCMFTLVAPTSKELDFLDSSPTFRLHSPTLRSTHFFFCALAMERGLFAQYSYADLSDVDMDSSAATLILFEVQKISPPRKVQKSSNKFRPHPLCAGTNALYLLRSQVSCRPIKSVHQDLKDLTDLQIGHSSNGQNLSHLLSPFISRRANGSLEPQITKHHVK